MSRTSTLAHRWVLRSRAPAPRRHRWARRVTLALAVYVGSALTAEALLHDGVRAMLLHPVYLAAFLLASVLGAIALDRFRLAGPQAAIVRVAVTLALQIAFVTTWNACVVLARLIG